MQTNRTRQIRRRALLCPALISFLSGCAGKKIADPFLRGTVTELWTIVFILLGGIVIGVVVLVTMNVLMAEERPPSPIARKKK